MKNQAMTLTIKYDLPDEVWEVVIPQIYKSIAGWLGFLEDGENKGIPYWFSFDETKKHIWASVEPSGLVVEGLIEEEEWQEWKLQFKKIATQKLGFEVGETELDEVD